MSFHELKPLGKLPGRRQSSDQQKYGKKPAIQRTEPSELKVQSAKALTQEHKRKKSTDMVGKLARGLSSGAFCFQKDWRGHSDGGQSTSTSGLNGLWGRTAVLGSLC